MSLKRVVLIAAIALLVLPGAALADGVNFGFGGGVFDASGATPLGMALTTQAGVGISSTLNFVGRLPTPPPGVGSPSSNFGTVDITTGQFTSGTSTDTYFAAGGTFTIISNAAFQAATGIASGTTLFSGTFVPLATAIALGGPIPSGSPAGTALVWSTLPCNPAQPANVICQRLYGALSGTIDPSVLAWLGLGASGNANGWVATITLNFTVGGVSAVGINIARGDAQLVVPEPATLALFGTGLIGLAGIVRRKLAV